MPEMERSTPPLLVRTTARAPDTTPTAVTPKSIPANGESETPAGASPAPLNTTVWVRNRPVTAKTPLDGPTDLGTYVTAIVQPLLPESEFPQWLTAVKSPEEMTASISVS